MKSIGGRLVDQERRITGAHFGPFPGAPAGVRFLLQERKQASADERRLAAAGTSDHCNEAAMVEQPEQRRDLIIATEEVLAIM